MDEIKSLMDQSIDDIREELWALGDSIYDNPEVALHEVFASTLLENWLEQHGFNVTRGLGTMSTLEAVALSFVESRKRRLS